MKETAKEITGRIVEMGVCSSVFHKNQLSSEDVETLRALLEARNITFEHLESSGEFVSYLCIDATRREDDDITKKIEQIRKERFSALKEANEFFEFSSALAETLESVFSRFGTKSGAEDNSDSDDKCIFRDDCPYSSNCEGYECCYSSEDSDDDDDIDNCACDGSCSDCGSNCSCNNDNSCDTQ